MKRKILKTLSAFLAINILFDVLFPSIIFAIGSGPSAPEYSSFMPSGQGISVSPQTGDMSYNLPLINLPCPEGDYPINLFYNAGIQPEQDASWVGLGWNLNVGSITRNVKGIPDDHYYTNYQVIDESKGHANEAEVLDGASKAGVITKYDYNTPMFANFDIGNPTNYNITSATQTKNYTLQGILNAKVASQGSIATTMFDCYPFYDNSDPITYDKNNPELFLGGSLPAYDQYVVSGQGIYGTMEPLVLENGSLFRPNNTNNYVSPIYDNANITTNHTILKSFTKDKYQFRFKGEFSNSFMSTPTNFTPINSNSDATIDFTSTGGLGYSYTIPDVNSYNTSTFKLAGANHVEYYLNEEINAGTAKTNGFINYQGYTSTQRTNLYYQSGGVNLSFAVNKLIGGFSVTTPDGTTYHYALPVLTYNQRKNYSYDLPNTTAGRNVNRKIASSYPYAYTWLLTSVTGSDFYDANSNGFADYGDYGRWTNFVYNKLTGAYTYRDPLVGDRVDGNGVKINSSGYKELYYLEAAYSRTHTVLFVKDNRTDATSVVLDANLPVVNPLKLSSAILMKNDAILKINTALGGTNTDFFGCFAHLSNAYTTNTSSPWSNTTLLDGSDIQTIAALSAASYASNVICEARLNYDYSLCPLMENQPLANLTTSGKLTLTSVKFLGQNGATTIPATEFNYDLENPVSASGIITYFPGELNEGACYGRIDIGASGSNLKEGDIVKMTFSDGKTYFATLVNGIAYYNPNIISLYNVIFLGNNIPDVSKRSTVVTFTTTKNPPYTKDFFDLWGNFKSDYKGFNNTKEEDKTVSTISSKSVDVWSLRKIYLPSGAVNKIEYESDSYTSSVFNQMELFNLKPTFQYTRTDNLLSISLSYCDYRTVNKNGSFIFNVKEDIAGKLSVGMRVYIASVGTFSKITEAANDFATSSEARKSYYGVDLFEITGITIGNVITGHFVSSGFANSNPFWVTTAGTYPDKKMFYHNASVMYFDKNSTGLYQKYGGGVRASKVTTKENTQNGKEFTTLYDYSDPMSGRSSGYVSCDPVKPIGLSSFNTEVPTAYNGYSPVYTSDANGSYIEFSSLNVNVDNLNKNALNANLLVPTAALYEYSAVKKQVDGNPLPTYQRTKFQKMTDDMLSFTTPYSLNLSNGGKYKTINIIDNTSKVGNILSAKTINSSNEKTIQETKYNYNTSINDLTYFQGALDQVFHEKKFFNSSIGNGAVTKLSRLPSVLMSSVNYDYLKNTADTITYRRFDLYSGIATKIETKDSYGNQLITETTSAYNVYPEMGLKINGTNYKNMLSAAVQEVTYKYNTNTLNPIPKYHRSNITTWSKTNTFCKNQFVNQMVLDDNAIINNIWRPDMAFEFNSNSLATDGSSSVDPSFDFNNPLNNSTYWIKTKQFQKYTPYSNLWQSVNANAINSGIRLGYNGSKLIAECDLANNYEFTFSGAEDPNTNAVQPNVTMKGTTETNYFGGDVYGVALRDATYAHTGKYSLRLDPSGGTGFNYTAYIKPGQLNTGRSYRVMTWIYNNAALNNVVANYNVNTITGGGSTTILSGTLNLSATPVTCGNWKLFDALITAPSVPANTYLEIKFSNSNTTTQAWIDDFRIQPAESSMKCYVYDEVTDKVTYTLDKNNFYTRYEYDNIGRLVAVYEETVNGEKKVADYYRNYARKP